MQSFISRRAREAERERRREKNKGELSVPERKVRCRVNSARQGVERGRKIRLTDTGRQVHIYVYILKNRADSKEIKSARRLRWASHYRRETSMKAIKSSCEFHFLRVPKTISRVLQSIPREMRRTEKVGVNSSITRRKVASAVTLHFSGHCVL